MKRYIKNQNEYEIPQELRDAVKLHRVTIDVIYEVVDSVAAASTIKPLQTRDGVKDLVAMDEYDSFLVNALQVFSEHDFEVLEERNSPYSASYYASLVKKQDIDDANYRYILFVRLSDHKNKGESQKGRQKFYEGEAERLKVPKTKSRQIWKLKEITVNKETFNSYDEALEYIHKLLKPLD